MQIMMNETLRELRRKKEVTQEELADHLGISPQAVSKWERGEGYPDITLLPKIALYFGVTVDELLGMERARIEEKIEEYAAQSMKYLNKGETEKDLALWEEAYAEFPNEGEVMRGLMYALFCVGGEENRKRLNRLGETLLNLPTAKKECKGQAIQLLAYNYDCLGDNAKALWYADMMDDINCCRNVLKSSILKGEDGCEYSQILIQRLVDLLHMCVLDICREGNYSPEERIRAWKSCIRIFEAVYEDGDYGFYACRMADCYRELAVAYARLGCADNCLDALENRVKFAILYDTAPDMKHTSTLLNRLEYRAEETSKTYIHNYSYETAKGLKNKLWDFVRETPRFAALAASLDEVAK